MKRFLLTSGALVLAAIVLSLLIPSPRRMSAQTNVTIPQNFANVLCIDSSGSGTVQSCSTTPSFTAGDNSAILYETTTANTGDVTIAVNGGSAQHVRKWLGASVLAAGDLPANTPMWIVNDGTYWELSTIGNVPGSSAPGWLSYYGDGSDGALTDSSSGNRSGIFYATTYTCSGTTTVTSNLLNSSLIIRATVSITIGAACSFVATGEANGASDSGGAGGGGGGGTAAGGNGSSNKGLSAGSQVTIVLGGSGGGSSGGTGGVGAAPSTNVIRSLLEGGIATTDYVMGGGAIGGTGGSSGGAGGNGGGVMIFVAPKITLASGASFTSNGSPGSNSGANTQGAGGGGGGGVIIIRSPNLTDSGATFSVAGGAAGSCLSFTTCGPGGAGGAGWSKEITQ